MEMSMPFLDEGILNQEEPIIYLHGPIEDCMAKGFIKALTELEHVRKTPIAIIDINTPGGDADAMLSILSAMRGSPLVLGTYVSSQASSAGAVIASAGNKGMRFASPFSYMMVHEYLLTGGVFEPIEDAQGRLEFVQRQNDAMVEYLAKNCGKSIKVFRKRLRDVKTGGKGRDLYLTPGEAQELGLVDHVGIPVLKVDVEVSITMVP